MEHALLGENIQKATQFINSEKFKEVDQIQQELLIAQVAAMTSYYRILETRIRLLNKTGASKC
jgi:hypothetical protein